MLEHAPTVSMSIVPHYRQDNPPAVTTTLQHTAKNCNPIQTRHPNGPTHANIGNRTDPSWRMEVALLLPPSDSEWFPQNSSCIPPYRLKVLTLHFHLHRSSFMILPVSLCVYMSVMMIGRNDFVIKVSQTIRESSKNVPFDDNQKTWNWTMMTL